MMEDYHLISTQFRAIIKRKKQKFESEGDDDELSVRWAATGKRILDSQNV